MSEPLEDYGYDRSRPIARGFSAVMRYDGIM